MLLRSQFYFRNHRYEDEVLGLCVCGSNALYATTGKHDSLFKFTITADGSLQFCFERPIIGSGRMTCVEYRGEPCIAMITIRANTHIKNWKRDGLTPEIRIYRRDGALAAVLGTWFLSRPSALAFSLGSDQLFVADPDRGIVVFKLNDHSHTVIACLPFNTFINNVQLHDGVLRVRMTNERQAREFV